MEKKHLYELMENFFYDCSENGVSDFKTWCEDNIDTANEQSLLDDIYEEVNHIASKLFD